MASHSGRAITLGVESFPVQTVGGDSGDSGEDVVKIEHGLFLHEKMGEA